MIELVVVPVNDTSGGNGGAIPTDHIKISLIEMTFFFLIPNQTLNFELVIDCVLSVFIFDGASVLAGVLTSYFANEQRSFRHQTHALGGNVRSAFNFPLDLW